jgi:hypothetical protein
LRRLTVLTCAAAAAAALTTIAAAPASAAGPSRATALCCPSSKKTVRYRWKGGRIVADATPPLIYGKRGSRLHLAR